jgi:hypothetical protein
MKIVYNCHNFSYLFYSTFVCDVKNYLCLVCLCFGMFPQTPSVKLYCAMIFLALCSIYFALFFTGVIKLCFRNTFSEAGFHYICGVINRYSGKIIDSNR